MWAFRLEKNTTRRGDAAGIASERIPVKQGDVLAGQTTPVELVGDADINVHGDLIYTLEQRGDDEEPSAHLR